MKPSDGYIAYIVNPKSGSSSGKLACWQFQRYLASRGYKTRVLLTRSLLHASELAAEAAGNDDCMLVVSTGGDGTQREVIRGLEGSDKPLLVIPGGTENLLANELGFDKRVQSLIAAFEGGQRRDLDLGVANGKCFASIVGCGFDGAMVEMVSERRTGHINYFNYVYPLWRTFWNHRFEPMKVEVDGKEVFAGDGLCREHLSLRDRTANSPLRRLQ